jgi:glycolate oxidase FAD binding subunit
LIALARAVTAVRSGEAEDQILGVRPSAVFTPESTEEAAAVMAECAGDDRALVFVGGRTEIDLGAPPRRLDAIVETTRLARILEHAPSDQIVTVQAGVRLSALQAVLAPHRQRLAIDPPLPELATLGGLIAANTFGPRRTRYGSLRDLLIGVSFVRADGATARGGGKVVKNVAGFDLPKLMVGSLGTLGLITTATFRLHPLAEVETTVHLPGRGAREIRTLVSKIREALLEPAAAVAVARGRPDRLDAAVRFEGFGAGVADQRNRLVGIARDSGFACDVLDDANAARFWNLHDALRTTGSLRAKIAAPRSSIETVAEILEGTFAGLENPAFLWYAALGVGFVSGEVPSAEAAAPALASLRRDLERMGGSLVLCAAPAGVRELLDVWGPPGSAFSLIRAVKDRLDPEARLAPGRFVGGI